MAEIIDIFEDGFLVIYYTSLDCCSGNENDGTDLIMCYCESLFLATCALGMNTDILVPLWLTLHCTRLSSFRSFSTLTLCP